MFRPSSRHLAALTAAAVLAAGAAFGAATASAPSPTALGAVTAHLRLTIATTSDWTQVHISPGRFSAQHTDGVSGVARTRPADDGVAVSGVTGAASVTVDAVLYEPTGAPRFTLAVTKGYFGTTTVTVQNLDSAPTTPVDNFVDGTHSLRDASNRAATTVSRGALLGATAMPIPRADARRLVLAFYYPWYASYTDPRLADRPQHQRTSWSPSGVGSMTAQAKATGVDGFVVSYAGDRNDGPGLDAAKTAAERNGQLFTGYLEVPRATSPTSGRNANPLVVQNWLVQLLARASSPSFLTASDGVPVVFVYGMAHLLPRHWKTILANLRTDYGLRVHLVGDAPYADYLPCEWGLHRYAANDTAAKMTAWSQQGSLITKAPTVVDASVPPKVFVGTVSPGFDDHRLRGRLNPVIPRDGGATYDDSWHAALAGQPDWVVVTSWNEWFEDTQIEPGVATGSQALTQTAQKARAFHAAH